MKNKKGFTLIELVIAIGLLSIFAITIGISLNRTLKSQKLKEQQEFVEKIKSAANLYATNNSNIVNNLSKEKGFVTITIEDLTNGGYLSENTIDSSTNEKVDKSQKIKISYDANGTIKIDYPYDKEDDYLQALDIYINLGDNSITDYCFHDLGTSNLSYVNSETGSFDHDYITSKESDGNYQNINCNQGKIYTTSPGTYRIIYNYKLKNKNTWKRKTRNVVVVDNVAPTCVITGNREANAPWRYEGLTDFSVGCNDAGGCLNVTQPKSPLINMKTETVTIQDKAGNKTICTLNVYSDQIKPTCTQNNTPTSWTNQNRTITTKCNDTLSGCVEGITTTTYTSDKLNDTFLVYDNAGNSGECNVTVKVDKTPPVVSLSPSYSESDGSITITATAEDPLSGVVQYMFSENANLTAFSSGWSTWSTAKASVSYNKTITTLGTTTWYFYAKDSAGNVARSDALTINLSAPIPDAPTINISNPYQVRKGGTVNADITWTSGQNVSAYCVQLKSAAAPTGSSSCWTSVSTTVNSVKRSLTLNGGVGKYNYVAYVKNSSGKISPVSNTSYAEVIDTTPTTPKLNISPYSVTSGGSITANVSWTGNENVNAFCVVKKGSTKPTSSSSCWNSVATTKTTGTSSFKITGSPGKYYYVAYVKNIYGEVSAASNEDYGEIKATKPSKPTLSTSTSKTTIGNKVTLTAKWTSGQNVTAYCIRSTAYAAPTASSDCWTSTTTSKTSGTRTLTFSYTGTYTYKAYVKNSSGLISDASNAVTITITINSNGDKYFCWYVLKQSDGTLKVRTRDDASSLTSSLICRNQPAGSKNIYNIYKNSTVTYSSFWGESNFTKSDGTHNYGWYHVSGSVEPNGTKHSITCYSAFYYTAQSCSDCISNDHCTTSRVLK